MSATIDLEVFRYRPDDSTEATFQTYTVPLKDDWVVLDALNHVKDEIDGTLSYRWSCRMGVCGSCGMNINGVPVLGCATYLKDYAPGPVRIEPLSHFPVVRDLVIDLSGFREKLTSIKPWIIRAEEKPIEDGEYLQTPAELMDYRQYTLCINCMLCYAACPIFGRDDDFIGPAAVALGQRYNLDSRDEGIAQREAVLAHDDGLWDCTFVGDCSKVCPAHVDPAGAIQQAKVIHTERWWKSLLMPWGTK